MSTRALFCQRFGFNRTSIVGSATLVVYGKATVDYAPRVSDVPSRPAFRALHDRSWQAVVELDRIAGFDQRRCFPAGFGPARAAAEVNSIFNSSGWDRPVAVPGDRRLSGTPPPLKPDRVGISH